jgi:TonB-dependent SusC/RagA subfamily outer membrane receptor
MRQGERNSTYEALMSRSAARPLVHAGLLFLVVAACSGRGKSEGVAPARPSGQPSEEASTISAADITRTPNESFEQYLQGRVAGVVVSRSPDGGIAVRVRGATSFNNDSQPLYILDGIPFAPGLNGALSGINPYDIESIRVLKDPADLAMYGSKGGNGVIVIKTKRPPLPPKKP